MGARAESSTLFWLPTRGLEFGVWSLGFGVWGLEFGVWSLEFGGRWVQIEIYNWYIYILCFNILIMDDFEQFDAFQKCRILVRAVADPVNRGVFSKDIALAAQLRKTMLSIYSNFGEGFERDGNREFVQFVSIAKGSVGELRAQLLYALDLGYLEREKFERFNELGKEAARYLGGLMRHLNQSAFRGRKFKKNPELRTPNSKPQTPNPKPQTPNSKLRTSA
jgi:four helix bundle protein